MLIYGDDEAAGEAVADEVAIEWDMTGRRGTATGYEYAMKIQGGRECVYRSSRFNLVADS